MAKPFSPAKVREVVTEPNMAWRNAALVLYHGTIGPFADDIEKIGISLAKCGARTDFGRGFYLTTNSRQARRHANKRFKSRYMLPAMTPHRLNPVCAAMLEYTVDRLALGMLTDLVFSSPDAEWMDFVSHCRGRRPHIPRGTQGFYDVVWGPVSQVGGLPFPPDVNQVRFHSQRALTRLHLRSVSRGTPQL